MAMAGPEGKLATYADLLALPEDTKGEVLAGELVLSPSPLPRHSTVQRAAGRFLGGPFHDDDGRGGPGGWWIFVEVDVALGPHDIVRPDLSGWRRERLPRPAEMRPIDVPPDWVCEVLSPSTAGRDRVRRSGCFVRRPRSFVAGPGASRTGNARSSCAALEALPASKTENYYVFCRVRRTPLAQIG